MLAARSRARAMVLGATVLAAPAIPHAARRVTFPIYLTLGPWQVHPHPIFEILAYFVGFRLFLRRGQASSDFLAPAPRWWVAVPEGLGYENVFRILIVQFMDAHSLDVRSVKKSWITSWRPTGA